MMKISESVLMSAFTVCVVVCHFGCSNKEDNKDINRNRSEMQNVEISEMKSNVKNENDRKDEDLSKHAKIALDYLTLHAKDFGLTDPQQQLRVKREFVDSLNMRHIRFQQIERDVPVWAHELSVHLRQNKVVYQVDGKILTGLSGFDTTPVLSPAEARLAARAMMPGGEDVWNAIDARLYIYPLQKGQAVLTYLVTIVKGIKRQFVFIGAQNGEKIAEVEGDAKPMMNIFIPHRFLLDTLSLPMVRCPHSHSATLFTNPQDRLERGVF